MSILESIKETLRIEANTLLDQMEGIGPEFEDAVKVILRGSGKLIVTGMGKSGHVGKKMAATFASTGTPSFFLHPGEAYHGDLGMISDNDVVLMISNSGETDELLKLIPFLKENKNPILAITAKRESSLAKNADIHLWMRIHQEACPLELAPTSSTTLTLAYGDAIAIALMRERDFKPDHFARFHPGGALGRKLLAKVDHRMRTENLPFISSDSGFVEIIQAISQGRLGLALVKENEKIQGLITDGDVRRLMESKGRKAWDYKATEFMTKNPKEIKAGTSLHLAEEYMRSSKITSLLVTGEQNEFVGIVQIYDL